MVENKSYTAEDLAACCNGRLINPAKQAGVVIRRIATLQEAGSDAVSWISDQKHAKLLGQSAAALVIGTETLLQGDPRGLMVADAEVAVADVLGRFSVPPERPAAGIHPSAVVHPSAALHPSAAIGAHAVVHASAEIGAHTIIHEGVSVGRGVRIGQNCEIYDRCVIYDTCQIGSRVVIHAGAVVGADGFGYIFRNRQHRKLAHIGTVIVEDDVEIGANSCIDRAKVGATIIGRGSKIDNLVMIAHNCQIGPLCVVAGQTGLSGSVRLGNGVVLGGQVGIGHGIKIGDGVRVGAQSGIIGNIPPGQVVSGYPAREHGGAMRDAARIRKLSELFAEVAELQRRVSELEAAANDH